MPRAQRTKTKRKKQTKERDTRYPRPLGLTGALYQYHQTKDPNQLQQIKELIINTWTSNGHQLNGETVSINDMALFLQMPTSSLMLTMNKAMIRIGKFLDEDKLGQWARAQFFQAFNLSLEGHSEATQQLHILKASQGGQYVPFISGEVNRAIANKISSTKPMIDMLKLLMDKGAGITINNNQQVTNQTATLITADEASRLIRAESQSLLDSPSLLAQKEAELMGGEGIPNINARTQDLSSIGIRNVAPPGITNGATEGNRIGHEDRREKGLGIVDEVLDEDEFKA